MAGNDKNIDITVADGAYTVTYYGAFKIWKGEQYLGEILAPDANTALRLWQEQETSFAAAGAMVPPLLPFDLS